MKAWIFQGKPSRYDVAEELKPGKYEEWVASSGFREMQPGDIVFFWRSGEREPERRGLYGWGKIVAEPLVDENSGNWVRVQYKRIFPHFIPDSALAENKNVATHQLFTMPIGTNFSVSPEQFKGILKEIKDRLGDKYLPTEDE